MKLFIFLRRFRQAQERMLPSNLSITGALLCSDAWEGPLWMVTRPCIWDAATAITWRYWWKWRSHMTFQATIPTLEHCLSLVTLRLQNITLSRRDMIFLHISTQVIFFNTRTRIYSVSLPYRNKIVCLFVFLFVFFVFLMLHCDRVGSHFFEQFKNEKNTRAREF